MNWVSVLRMLQLGRTRVVGAGSGLGAAGGLGAGVRLGGAPTALGDRVAGFRRGRLGAGSPSGSSGRGKGGDSRDRPTSMNASRTSSGTVRYQFPVSKTLGTQSRT